MPDSFDDFMERREAAARAFVKGDAAGVVALPAKTGPATFFDPGCGLTEGGEAIDAANLAGARSFAAESTTRFEIHDRGSAGDFANQVGYLVADVVIAKGGERLPMRIRVSEVFRHDNGDWIVVHRHASMAQAA